jgi:hypothetical protein
MNAVLQASQSVRQRAQARSVALLAAFAPPPGARRLTAAPGVSGGLLRRPAQNRGPYIASSTAWWSVPQDASAVLDYESTHLPRGFTMGGYGAVETDEPAAPAGNAHGAWFRSWGAGPNGLLTVEVAYPRSGQAYLRVDAYEYWTPVRPAAERMPAGVTVITITSVQASSGPSVPPLATVTDPARVSRIIAVVNGLALDTYPLAFGCPPMPVTDTSSLIRLAFLVRADGPALATVTGGPDPTTPCTGGIAFEVGGRQQPALASRTPFSTQVLALAGVT